MTAWSKIIEVLLQPAPKLTEAPARKYTTNTPTEKRCQTCGEVKPRTEFYPRRGHSPNSVSAKCIVCHLTAQRAKNAAKREARASQTEEQKQAEAARIRRKQKEALDKQPTGNFDWPEDD